MISVANIKTQKPDDFPREAVHVYIGRQMPNRLGSPLGNPFRPKSNSDDDLVACLDQYRRWLGKQSVYSDACKELLRLVALAKDGPLVLWCWCAPKTCHGDVVKAIIEEAITCPITESEEE